jgi:GTP-binding protein LepA
MHYTHPTKGKLFLNLNGTPRYVDLPYEVSRSLVACEGALPLIDAPQGMEAQTAANAHLTISQRLVIGPVLNNIDLPSPGINRVLSQLDNVLAIPREEAILASVKSGIGIDNILAAIIDRVPHPRSQDIAQNPCSDL